MDFWYILGLVDELEEFLGEKFKVDVNGHWKFFVSNIAGHKVCIWVFVVFITIWLGLFVALFIQNIL